MYYPFAQVLSIALSLFIMAPGIIPRTAHARTVVPLIQEFAAPLRTAAPLKIVAGPNGDLWFNQDQTNTLTRFNLKDKHFKTYHTFTSVSFPKVFMIDKDDNPWFIATTTSLSRPPNFGLPAIIGKISSKTGNVTRYQPISSDVPSLLAQDGRGNVWYNTGHTFGYIKSNGAVVEFSKPELLGGVGAMIAGLDGNLWFTGGSGDIDKVTPQGHLTGYSTTLDYRDYLVSIVVGADRNFWFLTSGGNKVGRMTPQGNLMFYPVPQSSGIMSLSNITSGTDGHLWFTDRQGNQLVSMSLQGIFTSYPIPTPASKLSSLTSSTDGTLWFTESGVDKIGRFIPPAHNTSIRQQSFQAFLVPQQSVGPQMILPGPKGDLWFSEAQTSSIGRITTSGALLHEYTTPQNYKYEGALHDLARGKDGNLWFSYGYGDEIARMTPEGKVTRFLSSTYYNYSSFSANGDGNIWFLSGVYTFGYITPRGKTREFGFPPDSSAYNGNATYLTAGPDGNLWITETQKNKIGRLTRSGDITEYTIPSASPVVIDPSVQSMPPSSLPTLITGGSDGNIWFLETNGDKLGRITPHGAITEFPMQEHLAGVSAMTFASDGNLWLADGDQLVRVTPSGIENSYQLAPNSYAEGITSGPDGNLWFADGGAGKIGRLQL